ncbi:hypothetical protein [Rubellimicrobium arenae]|uniref:hypothetical protein n=1 Tax=Rubellimicrobium arenae TaxID=2817372 RepID=UPI001B317D37|nr:hypothetical protein [Rubellimicrobium arenae]
MRRLTAAILALLLAGTTGSAAQGISPQLEQVRHIGPMMGTRVLAIVAGRSVETIEWHSEVEVRARTATGLPLADADRRGVLSQAYSCRHGVPRGLVERIESNGTYVAQFDCAWIQ